MPTVKKTFDGKIGISSSDGKLLTSKDSGLINVSFVVDFDLDQVRYYIDGNLVYTSAWTHDWKSATDVAQFRFSSAGVIEFSELKVTIGDVYS